MAAPQQQTWIELGGKENRNLEVPLYKSSVLGFSSDIGKISIANPEIADLLMINTRQMYVLGKALGSTNILVLNEQDKLVATINLEITHDLASLRQRLRELLPREPIKVTASQGSIVLSGRVSGIAAVKTANQIASTFLPQSRGPETSRGKASLDGGGVINLLTVTGPQQVMLEVQVAEISRQFLKSMDVNFNLVGSDSRLKMGAINGGSVLDNLVSGNNQSGLQQQGLSIPGQGIFTNYLDKSLMFSALLNIAKERGLAKVLSEPTLTTLSGQEARFISGGEFPVPVPDNDGKISIAFKEYGVSLKFLPVVVDGQRINLKLDLSVSELSNGHTMTLNQNGSSAAYFIPSLRKRSVQNTVELAHGQSLGIAGLISDNVRGQVNKFPGLAKLPVIGTLFRSQEFIKGQTELVIFVTPHFAQPGHINQFIQPTRDFIEPRDREFFTEGKLEGNGQGTPTAQPDLFSDLSRFFSTPSAHRPPIHSDDARGK